MVQMTGYTRYLLSELLRGGGTPDQLETLLTTIGTDDAGQLDVDGLRMLACLAIDLRTGGITLERLRDAANACIACGCLDRNRFAAEIARDAPDVFASCIVGTPISDGSDYVSLMGVEKFMFFFRAKDATAAGPMGVAKVIDYLATGSGPVPERGPRRAMRGKNRPITWITRLGDVRALPADAELLAERLGLPWSAGTYHVLALYYPAGFEAFAAVGQPNSLCETWEGPGLFVSALPEDGWGRTCGRRDPSHPGFPERVHGELPVRKPGYGFQVEYLGRVTLESADNQIALRAAEARWTALDAS